MNLTSGAVSFFFFFFGFDVFEVGPGPPQALLKRTESGRTASVTLNCIYYLR